MRPYVLILLIFAFATSGFADEILLKNGDRITGQILKMDPKEIRVKTEYAGDLVIALEAAKQVSSGEPLYVALQEGDTVIGTVIVKEGELAVETSDAGRQVFTMAAVAAIRSRDTYVSEVERFVHPGWRELWSGSVESGFSLTQGNSETINLSVGANAGRTTKRDKTSLYLTSLYAKDSTQGDSRTTANAVRWGGRYEYKLSDRTTAFGFTDMEHDEFQFLDLRLVLGGGFGWYLMQDPQKEFQVFGGGSYNYENFVDETRESAEVLAGQDFAYKLSDRISFKERLVVFPNLSEAGEFRITFDAGIITNINKWLAWNLTVSDRYLSNPVEGADENDILLTTGIRININQ